MGRRERDQRRLFYEFSLDDVILADHLLRRLNVFATAVLSDLHEQVKPFYSDIGRPSIGPELMIRMLLVGYCYGIRNERRLCQEVALHLARVRTYVSCVNGVSIRCQPKRPQTAS